jgi:hypothetical protein
VEYYWPLRDVWVYRYTKWCVGFVTLIITLLSLLNVIVTLYLIYFTCKLCTTTAYLNAVSFSAFCEPLTPSRLGSLCTSCLDSLSPSRPALDLYLLPFSGNLFALPIYSFLNLNPPAVMGLATLTCLKLCTHSFGYKLSPEG